MHLIYRFPAEPVDLVDIVFERFSLFTFLLLSSISALMRYKVYIWNGKQCLSKIQYDIRDATNTWYIYTFKNDIQTTFGTVILVK